MLASDGRFVERRACKLEGPEDWFRALSPRDNAVGSEEWSDAGQKTEPRTRLRPAAIGDGESMIDYLGNIATVRNKRIVPY